METWDQMATDLTVRDHVACSEGQDFHEAILLLQLLQCFSDLNQMTVGDGVSFLAAAVQENYL